MNTLLRVLVIVIALLGVTALVFASLNFDKRQLLLNRNSALVDQVRSLAKTIEAQDARDEGVALATRKDISDVTDLVLDNPDRKDIFENYPVWLETQNLPTLNFDSDERQMQLNSFYAYEDGKIKMGHDGKRVSRGPGTMQELLDQLLTRSTAQRSTLDKTRAELSKMRELATENVDELNRLKQASRVVRRDLTTAKGEIAQLETDKAGLERNVARLTSDKRELEAQVADAKDQVETLQEREVGLMSDLERAAARIRELEARRPDRTDRVLESVAQLSTGDKGKVIESNDEYKFAIIEFSPDAMVEIFGADREKQLPPLDMSIRRLGRSSASGDFVTKIKLRHSVKDKNLVVADILTDWQQSPVEKGDVVFF